MSNEKNNIKAFFPVFVYGTLRRRGQFHYYLIDVADFVGDYRIDGTLMCTASGGVYVQEDGSDNYTVGELYRVSYASLQRIFHLENASGSFPKAYELSVSLVRSLSDTKVSLPALWFSLKKEVPANTHDYLEIKTQSLLDELEKKLVDVDAILSADAVNDFLQRKNGMRLTRPTEPDHPA